MTELLGKTAPSSQHAPVVVCALATGVVAIGLAWLESSWLALIAYHLVLVAALAVRKAPRCDLREIVRGFHPVGAMVAVAVSGAVGIGFYFALDELDPSGQHIGAFMARMGPSSSTWIVFVSYLVIANPVLEELHWRGNYACEPRSAMLHDFCYSLFHVPIYLFFANVFWAILPVIFLTMAGHRWRLAAIRYGGLAVPILGHAAGNLGLMIAVAVKLGVLG